MALTANVQQQRNKRAAAMTSGSFNFMEIGGAILWRSGDLDFMEIGGANIKLYRF